MKKASLLFLLVLVTCITHVTAQDRIYNLEAIIVAPDDQATLTLNEPFDLEFYFKNLGPDSIIADDTLLVQFSGMATPDTYLVGRTLNPYADTIHFKTSVTVSAANANPVNFCVIGQIKNPINIDYDFANNSQCRMLYFEKEVTGIAEQPKTIPISALEIYPNPANDILRLSYKVKEPRNAAMTITDMSGRTVMHIDLSRKNVGDDNISTDVSGLTPGMYFVEINESHAKGRGRLLIKR